MTVCDAGGMTEEEARKAYLYPSGIHRMACYPDNDGYPQCMGDGGFCGYSPELGMAVCIRVIDRND